MQMRDKNILQSGFVKEVKGFKFYKEKIVIIWGGYLEETV